MSFTEFLQVRKKLLAAFCLINFTTGALYVWSILAGPLALKLGAVAGTSYISADLAPIFGIASGLTPFLMIAGGIVNDRFGPKWVIGAGGVTLLVGYALASFADSMTELTVAYGVLVGIGTGLVNGCTINTAVKYFPERRGFAGGLVTASLGIGAATLPFVVQFAIDGFGIDAALLGLCLFSGVVIVPLAMMTRPAPEGFAEAVTPRHNGQATHVVSKNWRGMIATPTFWPLGLFFMTSATLGLMLLSNAAGLAQEQIGLTAAAAASAVSIISIANTAGRFVSGTVSDRLGRVPTLLATLTVALCGLFCLGNAGTGDTTLFFTGLACVGLCFGAFIGIYPGLVADEYGPAHNSVNFSILMIGYSVGGMAGPYLMKAGGGALQDVYFTAAGVALFGFLCAFVYLALKRREKRSPALSFTGNRPH